METKLNIAEILKDKPKNTKLYSPLCGDCWLVSADYKGDEFGENYPIVVSQDKDDGAKALKTISLTAQGTLFESVGECMLFPSKEMRDWLKFQWKKGDVLTDENRFVIFGCFDNDEYTSFSAPFEYSGNNFRRDLGLIADEFRKVSDNIAQEAIKRIDEHYNGNLNLETLEIENSKQEYKDGDIVHFDLGANGETVAIVKGSAKVGPIVHASYFVRSGILFANPTSCLCQKENIIKERLATEEEKKLIFSQLADIGKNEHSETQQLAHL